MSYKDATNAFAQPPIPDFDEICGKFDSLHLIDENDPVSVKQIKLEAVRQTLITSEKIDYSTWAYIVTQLRFEDMYSLVKLTKALLPGSDCWFDDNKVLYFKLGEVVCEIDTLASCPEVLVHVGSVFPTEKPKLFNLPVERGTSIPQELPLAQAYLDLAESGDPTLRHEIAHALKNAGGKVDWIRKRLGPSIYKEELHVDTSFYIRELKKSYSRYASALDVYNLSKIENPKAIENARQAKAVLENLFPDDLIRIGYDWKGKKGKDWLYYDAFVESFTPAG